ncbi:hypothetical protein ANCCEY_09686 [Ancylostoma ceylanicum]|uniref:Uncharacterized protein n=1 Tax=Ancylostoma ceylanicum TaxID=53326 RepID=A0A0D6LGV1_9BILA|nr:hypothetical protein ANCCEY_09686 [Ancylostoma ceylanicum]
MTQTMLHISWEGNLFKTEKAEIYSSANVPYILAVQAFLFYLPRFVWKSLIAVCGYDLAGAIQYVDGFWATVKTNDATFKGEPEALNLAMFSLILCGYFTARIAAFEGRASAYIWDGLRLARCKGSRDMALFYTISTVIQSLNAWIQARRIITDYLATDPDSKTNRLSTEQFFRLLGKDGLFVLQQMALNLGDIPARWDLPAPYFSLSPTPLLFQLPFHRHEKCW